MRPNWRLMVGGIAVASVIQFFAMIFMPESPRWLGKEGRLEEQKKVVEQIYKPEHIHRVNKSLKKEVKALKESTRFGERHRMNVLCSVYSRCLFIGCSILAFQQLIGINTAMYYGPLIAQKAGIEIDGLDKDESAMIITILFGMSNFLGTLVCVFLIESKGRRAILLRTLPVMAVCWFVAAIGMVCTGEDNDELTQKTGGLVAVIAVGLFLFFFQIGISATAWTINTEIYPLHVIGTANSLAATTCWVTNGLVSELFKIVTEINLQALVTMYFVLGSFALVALVFTYYMIPETAGKSIQNILKEILGDDYKSKERALTLKKEQANLD